MDNQKSKDPKYITSNQQKGGPGKSTVLINVAKYAAFEKNKRVLFIDGDQSCNATLMLYKAKNEVFQENLLTDNTVQEILNDNGDNVKVHTINENIDLIAGYSELDKVQSALDWSNDKFKYLKLYSWVMNNSEFLNQYDYVLIDTHNGFDLFQKNAVAVSDVVIVPDKRDSVTDLTKASMKFRIEDFKSEVKDNETGETLINPRIYKIANNININDIDDKKYLKDLEKENDFLTWIPSKKAFAKSVEINMSMYDILKKNGLSKYDVKFYKRYKKAMKAILEA